MKIPCLIKLCEYNEGVFLFFNSNKIMSKKLFALFFCMLLLTGCMENKVAPEDQNGNPTATDQNAVTNPTPAPTDVNAPAPTPAPSDMNAPVPTPAPSDMNAPAPDQTQPTPTPSVPDQAQNQ